MITGVSSLCSKASEAESTFRPREGDVVIHFNEKEVRGARNRGCKGGRRCLGRRWVASGEI